MLARLLRGSPGFTVDPSRVVTNVVLLELSDGPVNSAQLSKMLREQGVLVGIVDASRVRMLTYFDVSESQIRRAAAVFERVFEAIPTP